MDLPSILTSWGLSGELQADSGLLACTAALNVVFTPLHFYGSVAIVQCFERLATRLWEERQQELIEKEKVGDVLTEEHMRKAVVGSASVLALCFDLAVSLFIMRRMYSSGTKDSSKETATDAAGSNDDTGVQQA